MYIYIRAPPNTQYLEKVESLKDYHLNHTMN